MSDLHPKVGPERPSGEECRRRVAMALGEMADAMETVEKGLNDPRALELFSDELRAKVAAWVRAGREAHKQAAVEWKERRDEARLRLQRGPNG